jgi:7-cyano-7-deazaguanine synthase in queuosine biosynthesis
MEAIMDYSRHLILFSGGADSTYFIEREPTARYLLHFRSLNAEKTKIATSTANLLGRYMTVVDDRHGHSRDGETNEIHALYDTEMVLRAGIMAASFGMKGIVLCFNRDDLGIDVDAVSRILRRAEADFDVLTPLKDIPAAEIRSALRGRNLRYVSCMVADHCGYCAKCKREAELASQVSAENASVVFSAILNAPSSANRGVEA